MTEKIVKKLNDSTAMRWTALCMVAFVMLCGYVLADVMDPLKPLLEKELLWTSSEYGIFTSAYGWFNVFLLMLIFGGMILDRMGVRFTGMASSIVMVVGCAIKYAAIAGYIGNMTDTILGIHSMVFYASIGFAIFGVGVETAGITVSKIIVKWFKGKEMALAMGMEMATARIGTMLAMLITVPIANAFHSVAAPILLCLILLCIGFISMFIYTFMDRKLDSQLANEEEAEEPFKVSDIIPIIKNKGFWLIAILCVLFYSAVFPFLKYAADLMVQKYHVSTTWAGSIPSLLPLGTLFLTPLFGYVYDRIGKGASIMILGSLMLIGVHLVFALPFLDNWIIAVVLTVILGIAFSLVPSAMWPSVPKIIHEKQLGTAYSHILWVQNWGLMGVPLLIGVVLDKFCKHVGPGNVVTYDYTLPMVIFTGFGVLALIFALMLKAEDKKKHYGLEEPNIKK